MPNFTGPRVKTVSVTYGRKVNLGDWSSGNVEVTIWADVKGEDLDSCMKSLWEMAIANVKLRVKSMTKKGNVPNIDMSETFLGLPITDDLSAVHIGDEPKFNGNFDDNKDALAEVEKEISRIKLEISNCDSVDERADLEDELSDLLFDKQVLSRSPDESPDEKDNSGLKEGGE
jgi:hypothetical protein